LNVLQIHGTDAGVGGGPIAMLRLQEGVRKAGVQSRILCMKPTLPDSVAFPQMRGERRLGTVTSRLGFNDLHCLGTFRISNLAAYVEADLLHIHGVHGGYFNYLALPRLTKRKPAIYTLHDMWPFTGHCVHSFDCDRWKTGCGHCPYPEIPNAIQRDTTSWEWKLKNWSYRRSDFTFVTPSTWLSELARQSMLKHFKVMHIPQGIDTELYRPLDPEISRVALGIPAGKKVLLYIVRRMNPSHKAAHIKGVDLFARAVKEMPASLKRETVLLLVGEGGEHLAHELDMASIPLGFVSNDRLKAVVYSAADILAFPSRAENSPLVLVESMACGTPVVAFNVGGVSDVVRHGVTGLLAEPENYKQLSEGIVQLLEDADLRARLGRQCRTITEKEYPLQLYVDRHVALYRDVLNSM